MARLPYKWLPAFGLVIGWTFAWTYFWQTSLFERFYREASPGVTVFRGTGGDLRILWIAAGVGLVLACVGVSFLMARSVFGSDSPRWNCVWLVSGAVFILAGLSLPIIYPSTGSLVVDEHERIVALERRWLYAETTGALAFDDIERVNLREVRRLIRAGDDKACQIGRGLSIISHGRTRLEVPNDFPHREVAERVAEVVGVPLEEHGSREC